MNVIPYHYMPWVLCNIVRRAFVYVLIVIVPIVGFATLNHFGFGDWYRSQDFFYSTPLESQQSISQINEIRQSYAKQPIQFDKRAYDLALARAQDMYHNDYYDHTNPVSGSCADTMKSDYGFSQNEYLAENLSFTASTSKAIEQWLNSEAHKINLLWDDHKGGAVACYSDYCVFLGVNFDRYGAGCY